MNTKNFRPHMFLLIIFLLSGRIAYGQAAKETFLRKIKQELIKEWPHNRTINLVFHGHSVPTGYFRTPDVRTLKAYPHLLLHRLKEQYPAAAINVITTSIGGENSEQGQKRFRKEVLPHRPDVLFIDYALNDRSIGPERSEAAMEKMIRRAQRKGIKVILMTPSPDTQVDIFQPDSELQVLADQISELAGKYHTGLADSYGAFQRKVRAGAVLADYMAQNNHPNEKGHRLIAREIFGFFQEKDTGE